ncbi:hypothetical protein YC2023_033121 [Brassica napus]
MGSVYPAGRAGIRTDIITLTLELWPTNETKKWRSLPASFPASTKAISSGLFSYSIRQF